MPSLIDRAEAKSLGLNRYFDGRSCQRGHVAERYTSDSKCVTCVSNKNIRFRASNPDYSNEWKKTNPEKTKRYQKTHATRRRSDLHDVKRRPCTDCGGTFPPECMDFDHVRGEKTADISRLWLCAPERVAAEIEKCELVCANCHRIRTRSRKCNMNVGPNR